jgi:hypothetical protein
MTVMTAANGVTVGDRVQHPARPEWGIGQVLDVDTSKAGVFFVEAGSKSISLRHVCLTILDPAPSHPLLDRIDANAVGGSGYRSIGQSIKSFLKSYEGGFYGGHYLRSERDYKVEAHELATTILGRTELEPLAARGAFAEICHRAMQVVNKTNLIFPNEKMGLKDGLKPAGCHQAFAVALYALLHGEGALPSRFQPFASVLEDMGAGKWTVATYFPFLLFPDEHQFIKPTYVKNAASICAFDIEYTPSLGWPAYERMLRFSDYLKAELATLKPRDNIDIQSFMWAIAQAWATR